MKAATEAVVEKDGPDLMSILPRGLQAPTPAPPRKRSEHGRFLKRAKEQVSKARQRVEWVGDEWRVVWVLHEDIIRQEGTSRGEHTWREECFILDVRDGLPFCAEEELTFAEACRTWLNARHAWAYCREYWRGGRTLPYGRTMPDADRQDMIS